MAVADCYPGLVNSREAIWDVEDSWIEQAATGPLFEPKHHVLQGGDHGEVGVLDLLELQGLEDRLVGKHPGHLRVGNSSRAMADLLLRPGELKGG